MIVLKRMAPAAGFVVAIALTLSLGPARAVTPAIVTGPPLDRNANLIVNGSFEDGHPGVVASPFGSPAPDSVYWALVAGAPHNPADRGDLALFPPDVELTPPGWIGSGGTGNYAEWSSLWPGIPASMIGPTGPALSTAPIHGVYSLYFGNFYMTSLNVPQHGIIVMPDGEWIFHDSMGTRVDPMIVPGQPMMSLPAAAFRPEVRLSQTVAGICAGEIYRLSFTIFGEFGHPDVLAVLGPLAADGFFGLEITGYDTLYLNIPSASGLGPSGEPGPFGAASEYTYTIEFAAAPIPGPPADDDSDSSSDDDSSDDGRPDVCGLDDDDSDEDSGDDDSSDDGHDHCNGLVDVTFINWGHFNRRTLLGGVRYTGVGAMRQTTEVVLDDVILNACD